MSFPLLFPLLLLIQLVLLVLIILVPHHHKRVEGPVKPDQTTMVKSGSHAKARKH